jgi:hypothetical protein
VVVFPPPRSLITFTSERSPYNNNIYIVYIIIAWAGSESKLYECVSGISETENETENEIQLSTNGFNK